MIKINHFSLVNLPGEMHTKSCAGACLHQKADADLTSIHGWLYYVDFSGSI